MPFFPLGGFTPLQSSALSDVATRLGATPMQVALAWLLHRSPNILLIPGTSSVAHLRENLAAADLTLSSHSVAPGWIGSRGVPERCAARSASQEPVEHVDRQRARPGIPGPGRHAQLHGDGRRRPGGDIPLHPLE